MDGPRVGGEVLSIFSSHFHCFFLPLSYKMYLLAAGAEEAYERLLHLNDRFALDGQAPPSYSGLLWCLGCFDGPKSEGAVLGTVRSRPLSRCRYDPGALLAAARRRAGERAGAGEL